MDSDFIQFIVMVVILALVAVFTWVRKVLERMAREREGGPPVDVGKAVREQIRKYMNAAGQHFDPLGRPVTGTIVDAAGRPVVAEPPPRPAEEVVRPAPQRPTPVVIEERRRPPLRPVVPLRKERGRLALPRQEVRRAIVTAELLGPPLALREEYRLF